MQRKRHILLSLMCLLLPTEMMAQWVTVEPERVVIDVKPVVVDPALKPKPKPVPKLKQEHPTPKSVGEYLSASGFYVQPAFQAGTLMGIGAAIGGYISNFNVEAFFAMGLAKSEDIYWTKGSDQKVCSYKPMAFGLRVGYGFVVAERLRLTPQVGLSAVSIKCSDGDSKGNVASAAIGVKGEYALSRNIAIFAAPEVAFAVTKSDVYKQLEDVSSKIKGWGTGFNARLGVTVSF